LRVVRRVAGHFFPSRPILVSGCAFAQPWPLAFKYLALQRSWHVTALEMARERLRNCTFASRTIRANTTTTTAKKAISTYRMASPNDQARENRPMARKPQPPANDGWAIYRAAALPGFNFPVREKCRSVQPWRAAPRGSHGGHVLCPQTR
jgi:hypothetical protein